MKYKIGDSVRVVGREEWRTRSWGHWIELIGKVGIVKRVASTNITIDIEGKEHGLMPESIKLNEGQLLFEFMYDEV